MEEGDVVSQRIITNGAPVLERGSRPGEYRVIPSDHSVEIILSRREDERGCDPNNRDDSEQFVAHRGVRQIPC